MTCAQRSDDARGRPLLVAFIAGALFGAGVGLLFAPRRGSEARRVMRESAEALRSRASETLQHSQEQVSNVVERGRGTYQRARDVAVGGGPQTEEASPTQGATESAESR